jgi:hypothetical protein
LGRTACADSGPGPEPSRDETRHALARWADAPPDGCAVGSSGPTLDPGDSICTKRRDQEESALRDARFALSIAIQSRIEKRIYDDGHGVARIARRVEPSVAARERAEEATELDRAWFDEQGLGPLGLPDVLYRLACIEG